MTNKYYLGDETKHIVMTNVRIHTSRQIVCIFDKAAIFLLARKFLRFEAKGRYFYSKMRHRKCHQRAVNGNDERILKMSKTHRFMSRLNSQSQQPDISEMLSDFQ